MQFRRGKKNVIKGTFVKISHGLLVIELQIRQTNSNIKLFFFLNTSAFSILQMWWILTAARWSCVILRRARLPRLRSCRADELLSCQCTRRVAISAPTLGRVFGLVIAVRQAWRSPLMESGEGRRKKTKKQYVSLSVDAWSSTWIPWAVATCHCHGGKSVRWD